MRPTLTLTSPEVLAAVLELDGVELPARTLARWAAWGLVVPSVRWDNKRGIAHTRRYNLSDLSRTRLCVALRKNGFSLGDTRVALAYLEHQLPDVLRPHTDAVLQVDTRGRATVHLPGQSDVELKPAGQLRLELKLSDVVKGNERVARKVAAG